MNPIEVRHLSKSFKRVTAVNDLSFQVAAGEIYGLVGPDGAGKTTTMRLICAALLPTIGKGEQRPIVTVAGFDVLKHPDQARTQIGYLAQRFALYEDLSVLENLRFFAEVRGLQAQEWRTRCMELLDFVGLAQYASRRAGQLSGGMRQKLGLAAALIHQPVVLLLDEPTTGVDPVTRQDFWQLIIRLVSEQRQRNAVLVSTPYMDEADRCTRVGFMRSGRLIAEGTPAQLRSNLEGQIIEVAGAPLRSIRSIAEQDDAVVEARMLGDRIHLRILPGTGNLVIDRLGKRLADQGFPAARLRLIAPMLEDVFMSLLEEPG